MRLLYYMFASLPRFISLFCFFDRSARHLPEIRRAHEIESVAASFGDYLLLEAAYDVDFDE